MSGEFSPVREDTLLHGDSPERACETAGALPESSASLVCERYLLKEIIGKGGMGSVYRAHDLLLDRFVALKLLPAHLAESPAALARFQREAKAAAGIRHAAVVSVYDFGVSEGGQPFLVMELIDGKTLKEIIEERGQLSFAEVERVFTSVIQGLMQAHSAGVVHRDLKPGNIMLSDCDEPEALILDFGIAKVLSAEGENSGILNLTQTGEILGSPLYMSPEQCLGEETDFRSDIYSLSCCLFEALTGQLPFKGKNAFDTMTMHVNRTPASLSFSRPDLNFGTQLEEVVAKGLAKSRESRYQSLEQFNNDLIAALRSSNGMVVSAESSMPARARAVKQDWKSTNKMILLAMLVFVACWGLAFPLLLQLFLVKPVYAALALTVLGALVIFLSQLVFGPSGLLFRSAQNRYVGENEAAHRCLLKQLTAEAGRPGALELGAYLDSNLLLLPRRQTIVVPPAVRADQPFAFIVGKSGKGKTRLLRSLIRQDRLNGSIFVLDTHGTLFDGLKSELSLSDRVCFLDFSASRPELAVTERPLSATREKLSRLAAQSMVEALMGLSAQKPGLSKDKELTLVQVLEGFFFEQFGVDELASRLDSSGISADSSALVMSLLAVPAFANLPALLEGSTSALQSGALLVKLPLHALQAQAAYLACFLNRFVVGLKTAGHITGSLSVYIDGGDRVLDEATLEFSADACGCPGFFYLVSMQSLTARYTEVPERLLDRTDLLISFAVGQRDAARLGKRIFPSLGLRIHAPTAKHLLAGSGEAPRFFSSQEDESYYQDLLTNLSSGTFFCRFTKPVESVVKIQLPEES